MTTSQLIIGTIMIFIIYKTFISFKNKKLTVKFTLIWFGIWLMGLFFLFQQDLLSRLANFLGISRGVDLVLYLSVIALFYSIFRIFVKLGEIEKNITLIVRKKALNNK